MRPTDRATLPTLIEAVDTFETLLEEQKVWAPAPISTPPLKMHAPRTGVVAVTGTYDWENCCWNCGQREYRRKKCRQPARLYCSRCGQVGRFSRDCPCLPPGPQQAARQPPAAKRTPPAARRTLPLPGKMRTACQENTTSIPEAGNSQEVDTAASPEVRNSTRRPRSSNQGAASPPRVRRSRHRRHHPSGPRGTPYGGWLDVGAIGKPASGATVPHP